MCYIGRKKLLVVIFCSSLLACGGSGDVVTAPEKHSPEFTSLSEVNTAENNTASFYTAQANDSDSYTLTYSIVGGVDHSLFNIDAGTGELKFTTPPDFEAPADEDGDNVYQLLLRVEDTDNNYSLLSMEVAVSDVVSQLTLEVDYPITNANLGGLVAQTTVRGRISALENGVIDVNDIKSIEVNGVAANVDAAKGRWHAQVPVVDPETILKIHAHSKSGNSDVVSMSVSNQALLVSPSDIALDTDNNRALITDIVLDAIIAVDLSSGVRTILSGLGIGYGDFSFSGPSSVVVDSITNPERPRALVTDILGVGPDRLMEIDLSTGNRAIISDENTGTGLIFRCPKSLVLDSISSPSTPRVLIADRGCDRNTNRVFAVDLSNGDRTVVADNHTGIGDVDFSSIYDLAMDTTSSTPHVFVLNAGNGISNPLISVDLSNGDRTLVAKRNVDDGIDFRVPNSFVIDSAYSPGNTRALIMDSSSIFDGLPYNDDAFIAVDLSNGNRNVISDNEIGNGGFDLNVATGIVLDSLSDASNPRALVVDSMHDAVISINLASGDRTILSQSKRGDGNIDFSFPEAVVLDFETDEASPRALIIDGYAGALVAVNLSNGDRTVISNSEMEGVDLLHPNALALDAVSDTANPRAIVIDRSLKALLAVDLHTGSRSVISDINTGLGDINFHTPNAMVLDFITDPLSPRALVVDSGFGVNALIAVNLSNGNRTVISSSLVGSGDINFSAPSSIALDNITDPANPRVLITDQSINASLISVDLSNGNRTVLSDADTGTGASFTNPYSVVLDPTIAPDSPRALVLDRSTDALVAVNLETGDRKVLSGPGVGSGPTFLDPISITLDAARNRAFVTDASLKSIFVVDLVTGERAIFSK